MEQYTKIQTVYKRDERTKKIIEGDYSMPEFEYLKDNQWVFTEKVDGTNTRVMWDGERVVFGGGDESGDFPSGAAKKWLRTQLTSLIQGVIDNLEANRFNKDKEIDCTCGRNVSYDSGISDAQTILKATLQ